MPRLIGKVGEQEQIYTGTHIAGADEAVILRPFEDDPSYSIKFTVRAIQDSPPSNNIYIDTDDILNIEHFRTEALVLATATRVEPNFATDGDFDYFISSSVMPCRSPKGVIYQIVYTVLRNKI